MGNFFTGTHNAAQGFYKKIVPKELRKATPKELTIEYMDAKIAKEAGMFPGAPDPVAPPPPPEQVDADAYRMNQSRRRRLARAAGSSTLRTSPSGAAYSAAPKSLTGA